MHFEGCPHCGSLNASETDKFDGTNIDKDECIHDFECDDCGALFQIYFLANDTLLIQAPEGEPGSPHDAATATGMYDRDDG